MNIATLVAALLLPWLGGYFWLGALARRFSHTAVHPFTLLGYGLFLGYAGLQGIVLAYDKATGGVAFLPILALIALLTSLGGWLYLKSPRYFSAIPAPSPVQSQNRLENIVLWLLVAWIALHLIFTAIEIVHRPVFPWDAWLSWIYRAKAWYFAGDILAMDHPATWVRGTDVATYNVAGQFYPTFSPVLALWSALALGEWRETLINLPVMFCGVALGLAMFGQARDQGLPMWAGALAAYLLLSIPLVGAHLSLAGQADIWMAGFAGLGFIAILRGLIQNQNFQLLLGLGMVAMGIATKVEGGVWFLSALLVVALVKLPRVTLLGLLSIALLCLAGWATGVVYLEIPLLGGLGIHQDRLHIPLLGSYGLQDFDLLDDYLDNFLGSGTWHLLWSMLLLAVAAIVATTRSKLGYTLLAFYAVTLAAQVLIFEGTAIGKWAEDWTAINRLPLHFAPALMFSVLLLITHWRLPDQAVSLLQSLKVPALALLITLAGALAYLSLAYPSSNAEAARFPATALQMRVGGGGIRDGVGIVTRWDNNVAILSTDPIALKAADLPLLTLKTEGDNQKRLTFFWRRQGSPEPAKITVWGRGTRYINLAQEEDWSGTIAEIGLVLYNDNEASMEFHGLSLSPNSLGTQLAKLNNDWRQQTMWSQRSVHWLPAGAASTNLPLPMLMAAWLSITLLITLVTRRQWPGTKPQTGIIVCAIIAWMLLDLRWTANRVTQASATLRDYPTTEARNLLFGDDLETSTAVAKAIRSVPDPSSRLLIMAEDKTMRFQMLRAKYHALPTPTFVHEGTVSNVPTNIADHVLVLRTLYIDPSEQPVDSEAWAQTLAKRSGGQAQVAWDIAEGFLISLDRPKSAQ